MRRSILRRLRGPLLALAVLVLLDLFVGLFLRDGRFRGRFVPPYELTFIPAQKDFLAPPDPARPRFVGFDRELGWAPYPSASSEDGLAHTNAAGMRGKKEYARKKPAGVLRLAAFGDSFTFGSEVSDEDGWCRQLEVSGAGVEVLNFGASGYGMDQAYLRYLRDAEGYEIDVVLLGLQFENVLRNVNVYRPAYVKHGTGATKPRFRLGPDDELVLLSNPARSRAHLRRLVESRELVDLLLRDDFWVRRAPAAWRGSPLFLSSFARLIYAQYERDGRSDAPYLEDPQSEPFRLAVAIVRAMADAVRERGQRFVVVVLPARHALDATIEHGEPYGRALVDAVEGAATTVVDCSGPMLRFYREHGDETFSGHHYSRAGNGVVARTVHDAVVGE